ncbi:CidA/LrgA family protein [Burkholderia vietnamiensis]|uniref:CidA/LrgA family protein n=1 Tax=Burkholderia vietnamiensis TaxID=60552 RepID=UPI000AB04BFA|nr:CidA/LrgA family protein [Burkholderia vietnamiensis]
MHAGIAAVAGPAHRTAGPAFRSGRQLLFPSIAETLTRHLRLLDRRATDDNPDDRCDRVSAFASSSRGMAIMLNALSTLLVSQLVGELLAQLTGAPIPGPLLGMLLLLGFLIWKGGPSPELERFGKNLLSWLAMLFVPAATGLMTAFDQLATDWWRIATAIFVSTLLGLATTGWLMQRLSNTLATETESRHDL